VVSGAGAKNARADDDDPHYTSSFAGMTQTGSTGMISAQRAGTPV
jgi:hypothetical protein